MGCNYQWKETLWFRQRRDSGTKESTVITKHLVRWNSLEAEREGGGERTKKKLSEKGRGRERERERKIRGGVRNEIQTVFNFQKRHLVSRYCVNYFYQSLLSNVNSVFDIAGLLYQDTQINWWQVSSTLIAVSLSFIFFLSFPFLCWNWNKI